MNLNAGQKAGYVRKPSGQEMPPDLPEPVKDSVSPQGVEPGVAENDLENAAGRRILGKNIVDIFADGFKHSFALGWRYYTTGEAK
jgi:hypothetical protein